MTQDEKEPSRKRPEALETKFNKLGISAVAAAAHYCHLGKPKRKDFQTNPQLAVSVYDTD